MTHIANSIWASAHQLVKKPVFTNEEATRSAQLLWKIILFINIGTITLSIVFALLLPEEAITTFLIAIILPSVSFGILWLLHNNRFNWAAHIFCITLLIVLNANAFIYEGIRNVNILPFFVLISICGLLIGKRGLIIYTSATVLSLITLFLLETEGILVTEYRTPILAEDLIFIVFIISICASLIYTAIHSINDGYSRLKNTLIKLRQTTVSKQHLDNILESMGNMLFVVDASLRIHRVNQASSNRLKATNDSLVGHFLTDFLAEPMHVKSIVSQWQLDSTVQTIETQLLLNNCEKIETIFKISALESEDAQDQQFVCVVHDITAIKESEQALRKAAFDAKEAADAKSNFLTNMSHEIRTPLNAVIGMISVLEKTPLNEEQGDLIATVKSGGEQLVDILGNILDYSAIESDEIQLDNHPFDVFECVKKAMDSVENYGTQKSLSLSKKFGKSVPQFVLGDGKRLLQVLSILLNNAVKFTNSGTIGIEVNGRNQQGKHELTFIIEDSGMGISKERLDSIFLPFQQEDGSNTRKFGGTGIGLAICKRLVALMGGQIWVDSTVGEGSKFCFTAVFSAHHPQKSMPSPKAEHGQANYRPLNILVTDDNKINVKVSTVLLSKLGHTIDAANSGAEALQAVQNKAYDVIFMDIQMPEMDGVETTQRIKNLLPIEKCPPIIALTANALPGDRESYLKAGLDGYISKPVKIDILKKTLDGYFSQ